MTDSGIDIIVMIFLCIVGLFIYFLPTIIASGRNSTATFLIFLVNLFGGWTVALWIFVFIWAFCAKKK
ncbi:superinfection immunity protein [Gelidibacter gilvus]|uniref:Superinfection immunity protein n=2 Tax=Gelidibacter maritimus TaxID=2761487 RepID=A0A7W2M8L3_9FLAO|nr:superinfection immunity protein [Gelidibacter maritimus]